MMSNSRRPADSGGPRRSASDLDSAYRETVRSLAPAPPVHRRPWLSRGLVRLGLIFTFVIVLVVALTGWSLYRASQQVPEFYVQALAAPPANLAAAGQELERQALALNSQVRRPGTWEARFTQEQINGWLAADLPRKFPGSLPGGASEPRVAIAPGEAQIAVKWQQGNQSAVLSAVGDIYLTDQPNEVAVRIISVRAGAIPIPLARFLDEIAERANASGLPLRWSEMEGDPVALLTLPLDRAEFRGKRLVLDELRLEEAEIVVAGHTDDESPLATGPASGDGAAHQPPASDTRQR